MDGEWVAVPWTVLILQLLLPLDNTPSPWLRNPSADPLTVSNLDPRLMGKILDVKSDAQMLKGRVDNISTLGSDLKTERGRVDDAEVQMQIVNTTLKRVRSQILSLETSMKIANDQLQILTMSWGEVDSLSAKIPELKRDLDKASALNTKVQGLQNSLENVNKLLKQQSK
jgi:CD207 antigen